jgi:lipopolysaccharide transport system ATP-binding protein
MTAPVIQVHNLSKRYRRGDGGYTANSLRAFLEDMARAPIRRLTSKANESPSGYFWALQDISFAIEPGQVVGIVGHNGAGKSVLLKILSKVTRPSSGYATVRGRVGAMLEAGAGFHPELTGRENVFLSGNILGLRRPEIKRKFETIAAFSGVEEFLDTPIKRYSNGMRGRLAFAIAVHLEPEILILDEVLAVEDAEFQGKCHAKIKQMAQAGQTVLLISHNTQALADLCHQAILLNKGHLVMQAGINEVLAHYQPDTTTDS